MSISPATRPRRAPTGPVIALDPVAINRLCDEAIRALDHAGALASAPGGPVATRDVFLVTAVVGVFALALHEARGLAGGG